MLLESWAKKYCQLRKIRHIFMYLNHKVLTRNFINTVEQLLSDHNTDGTVLYAYEVPGVEACAELSKRHNLPFVTRFQGTVLCGATHSFADKIRYARSYKGISQKADLVIMTDDGSSGDVILKYLKNDSPTLFLKNGLELLERDLPQMKASFPKKKFLEDLGIPENSGCVFLTVSRLEGWKKVERSIDGFYNYLKNGNSGKLIIVGDGASRAALTERVNRYGIQQHVVFTGSVPHSEVYNYFMACDVFLSFYDLTNVGNPLLEAMTLGKPVITLDVGTTNTVVTNGENGILLQYEDLPQLGSVMEKLAKDPQLRERLGSAAEEYARKNLRTWKERMNIEFKEVEKLLHR